MGEHMPVLLCPFLWGRLLRLSQNTTPVWVGRLPGPLSLANHGGASNLVSPFAAGVGFSFSHIESCVTLEAEMHASWVFFFFFKCSQLALLLAAYYCKAWHAPPPTLLSTRRSELITRKKKKTETDMRSRRLWASECHCEQTAVERKGSSPSLCAELPVH